MFATHIFWLKDRCFGEDLDEHLGSLAPETDVTRIPEAVHPVQTLSNGRAGLAACSVPSGDAPSPAGTPGLGSPGRAPEQRHTCLYIAFFPRCTERLRHISSLHAHLVNHKPLPVEMKLLVFLSAWKQSEKH